jgi:Ca2+/H+ antiporter, TMEM165/GDT1 family
MSTGNTKQNNMKKLWIRKGLMFLVIFAAAVFLFGWLVMALWNAILPAVIGVKAISFIQALGILVLSKILFGGFGGRHWRGSPQWKQKMKQRWDNMTPEEREQFKAEWKNRCGHRWGMRSNTGETEVAASE